jgi:hypothetical protein
MRVKPIVFGALVIAIFFGTIGASIAAGAWQSTGRSSTAGAGGSAGPGSGGTSGSQPGTGGGEGSGDAAGAGGASVKGWMAIGDVAEGAGVDVAEIIAAFDLPADTQPSTPLKDLESDAFSVSALRTWLAERAGDSGGSPGDPQAAPGGTTP